MLNSTPAPAVPATPANSKTVHPGLTLKGSLNTITGILTAISAAGTVAVNVALFHAGWVHADVGYAMDAETVAMAGVHALALYFTS
jgi:hypothetical protein